MTDTVALLVEVDVVSALNLSVALWRDNDLGAAFSAPVDEMVGVISLVGDGVLGFDIVKQVMGQGDVVALAGRAN